MSKLLSLSEYIADRKINSRMPNPNPVYWEDTMPGGFLMSTYHLASPFIFNVSSDPQFGNQTNVMLAVKCNFGQMMWLNSSTYDKIGNYRRINKDAVWTVSVVCSTDCSFTMNFTGMNSDYSRETNHFGVLNFRICDGEMVYYKNKELFTGMHGLNFDVQFNTQEIHHMDEGQIFKLPTMDYGRARNDAYNARPTLSIAYGEE